MVPDLDVIHSGADRLDDPAAFVAKDDGEGALGVVTGERVGVAAGKHERVRGPIVIAASIMEGWAMGDGRDALFE